MGMPPMGMIPPPGPGGMSAFAAASAASLARLGGGPRPPPPAPRVERQTNVYVGRLDPAAPDSTVKSMLEAST